MDESDRLVGERLAVSRRRKGLSQVDFGAIIGRSESWVSKVETGAMRLDSLALARRIAELLGVDLAYLLGLESSGSSMPTPAAATGLQLRHLLINPSDWEIWDPVRRRWFFAQAGAMALAVLQALRLGPDDDFADRVTAARDHRGRLDADTIDGLGEIVLGLRTAYRSASAYSLMGPSYGTLNLLMELAPDAGTECDRVVSLIGQVGTLLATAFALDLEDFEAARPYLRLAMRAAQESSDSELMAFTLGGRAFHAAHGGDLRAGVAFADAALDAARLGIHWRTHGWLLAVASEMHASNGSALRCEQLLDDAATQLARPGEGKQWIGIGAFNSDKLTAYRGGDLMRLGRYGDAQETLGAALAGPVVTRRALLLDFGGVITTDFYGALRSFCAREGLADNAIEVVLRTRPDVRAILKDAECGRISQADFEVVLGETLGVPGEGLVRRAGTDLKPCQPVLDLAARARASGLLVGVLSNSWGSGAYDAYDAYDLDQSFDTVVISDQVGMSKPDEAIYRLAADKLGVAPEECVFADDNPSYLPPAQTLGMVVVHFTSVESGVAEISALLGLG